MIYSITWWKVQSSMAIDGFPALVVSPSLRATEFLSKINLSFIPNLHSGIPLKYMTQIKELNYGPYFMELKLWELIMEWIMRIKPRIFEAPYNESVMGTYLKYDFIMTLPATWADKTWPCGDMSKLTDSKTSKNNSFLLYFIPSRRHPIWPVTCDVIWACSSLVWDFTPCWVMNVFRAPTWNISYRKSYSSFEYVAYNMQFEY